MTNPPSPNLDTVYYPREWLLMTLACIGDAVVTTDHEGRVTFLNRVAMTLTGWTQEAVGQPLDNIFRVLNEDSRQAVNIPTVNSLEQGNTYKLADHSLLIAKDGSERPISDSAALIRNDNGEVAGMVLVFRDITERRKTERSLAKSLSFADDLAVSEGVRAAPLSGSRILVVDDNEDSAASLAMLLQFNGNDIRTANDGLQAVSIAEAFHPELVLLDIGLPSLNGYDVARRIRQQPWGRDVILIALTGLGQDEDRRRSKGAGFNFHMVKPVKLSALETLLAGSLMTIGDSDHAFEPAFHRPPR